MCQRLIYLVFIVLVLAAGAETSVCRGDIVSHWRLDSLDGNGQFPDIAGSNPGTPTGSTTVDTTAMQIGVGSAQFTGDGEINVGQGDLLFVGKPAMTITAWINPANTSGTKGIFSRTTANNACYNFRIDGSKLRLGLFTNVGWNISASDGEDIPAGTWTFVAGVYDGSSMTRYVNGSVSGAVMATSGTALAQQGTAQVAAIGNRAAGSDQRFVGNIDDVRVYDHALTPDELQEVMAGGGATYLSASSPAPQNGVLVPARDVQLAGGAGDLAVSHKVYFGTDPTAVGAAAEGTLLGETTETTMATSGLQPGTMYYWRVDEIDSAHPDSPWVGKVWSFFIPPLSAYDPSPADGMQYLPSSVTLSWKPGLDSLLHTVQFGADPATLGGGLPQVGTTYTPEGPLESGKTYYWRVDEFDPVAGVTTLGAVWSFTIVPVIPSAEDPSLLGWWKMDEVNAGLAVDWSGHVLHGIISGTPQWIDGVAGAAVSLNGTTDYFTTPVPVDVNSNTVTMTAWIKPTKVHSDWAGIIFTRGTDSAISGLNVKATNQLAYHWKNDAATYGFNSNLIVPMNDWSFVALVVAPEKATLYLDGSQITAENPVPHSAMAFNAALELGRDPQASRLFGGGLDDLRVYTRSLTAAEIDEVMAAGTKPPAPPEAPGTIESFDEYNAYAAETGPDIWDVWLDGYGGNGTGSTAGHITYPVMERVVVYDNRGQSLPLGYNNTGNFVDIDGTPVGALLSEVSRTFSPALDLTQDGATQLVVHVCGQAANTAEPTDNAYLLLSDGTKTDEIPLVAAADLTNPVWKEIRIDLNTLTVNRAKVTKITLGVGSRAAPQVGGAGTIFIDEIARQ